MNKIIGIRADKLRVQLDCDYESYYTGMSNNALQCAAKSLGIKKTQMQRKLHFYSMTEDQIKNLAKAAFTSKLRQEQHLLALAVIDESDYDEIWDRVRSGERTKKPGSYDFRIKREYKLYKTFAARMGKELAKAMTKLSDDPKKIRRINQIQDDIGTKMLKKVGTRQYYEYVLNRQKVVK